MEHNSIEGEDDFHVIAVCYLIHLPMLEQSTSLANSQKISLQRLCSKISPVDLYPETRKTEKLSEIQRLDVEKIIVPSGFLIIIF